LQRLSTSCPYLLNPTTPFLIPENTAEPTATVLQSGALTVSAAFTVKAGNGFQWKEQALHATAELTSMFAMQQLCNTFGDACGASASARKFFSEKLWKVAFPACVTFPSYSSYFFYA
jgi:hypothetical protein